MLNTGEIKPTTDASFLAATLEFTATAGTTSELTPQATGGRTSERSTTFDTPAFFAAYGPMTGYRLADAANAVTFGRAQLTSDTTATDQNHPTVLFTQLTGSVRDYLALYKHKVTTSSPLGSGAVTPQYSGNAGWQHTVGDANSRRTRLNYFAFGPATPESAMPRSGVFQYSVMGSGNYAADNDLYFTSDLTTLSVDFGKGTVSGTVAPSGDNLFNGSFGGIYYFWALGSIKGNGVTNTTSSGISVATGQFRILFVGPHAEELIMTYVGQDGRGSYVGSAAGVRNPYLQ